MTIATTIQDLVKHRKRSTLRVANSPLAIRDGSHMRLVSKSGPSPAKRKEREEQKTKRAISERGACLGKVTLLCPGLGCGTCQLFFV